MIIFFFTELNIFSVIWPSWQGNLFKGIDNYLGVGWSGAGVQGSWSPLDNIFVYIRFWSIGIFKKINFAEMLTVADGRGGRGQKSWKFADVSNGWSLIVISNLFVLQTLCYREVNICKQLEIPYFQTVLLSIPFDFLTCFLAVF